MALKKRKKVTAKKKKTIKKRIIKKRKISIKKPLKKVGKAKAKQTKEKVIGQVTHYFPKVRAAVVKLKAPLAIGAQVKIKGHTTDFQQNVTSLQIDHVSVNEAKKGQEIGLLVDSRVRQHDMVYKA